MTVIDLLAAVPSVVFGLWGIIVVGPALVPVYDGSTTRSAASRCSARSSACRSARGRSFMTAGIIVAIMIMPIITSITREVFATVPTARTSRPRSPSAPPAGR